MDKRIADLHTNYHIGAKRFLPYVFFLILLVLLIPVYVTTFKITPERKTLFVALEDEKMALAQTSTFTDLVTYDPFGNEKLSGYFEVVTTNPSALGFRVLNSSNGDITTGYNLSNPIIINFNNKQTGAVTLQFTNTHTDNYITRIDIVY